MRQKFNYLFIGLLFSGLAFFSYLFLLLYSDFTPQHLEVLISFKSFILILAAFNLVGFGVLMTSSPAASKIADIADIVRGVSRVMQPAK